MTEKQKMPEGSAAPTKHHAKDVVECFDGSPCQYGEAYFDCEGGAHCTEEARNERDAEVVSKFLAECSKWWGIGRSDVCSRLRDYFYPNRPEEKERDQFEFTLNRTSSIAP